MADGHTVGVGIKGGERLRLTTIGVPAGILASSMSNDGRFCRSMISPQSD